jgi:PAS domain S-box-containing protein
VTASTAGEAPASTLPRPEWNEGERLEALADYGIIDTPREKDFDEIAKIASVVLNMPISVVTFVESNRQWFKAEVGLDGMSETPRDIAFCHHAIRQPNGLVVSDTTKDPRFQNNPLVTESPHLRFYAGANLETPSGLPLGTLCVLDYEPREFTDQQFFVLQTLARQVMAQLDLRRALRAQSRSEARLNLALDASGVIGTWNWDIAADRIYADPRFVALFGGEPNWSREGKPLADYIKAVHPDDLARVRRAIDTAMTSREPLHEEYRLVQRDGSVRWIDARGRCHFDGAGRPSHFPGVAVDITDRKASEHAAVEAAGRFHVMADSMAQKIFTADPAGAIDYYNRAWAEFTGVRIEELIGTGWRQVVHPEDDEPTLRLWLKAVAEGKSFEHELRLRRNDGTYRWHLSRAHAVRDSAGAVMRWIGSTTDVDDQRRSREQLERMVEERTENLKASVAELEAFSYSISHDMRAPLRAMLGFSEILQEEYGPQLDEQANRFLDRIRTASARMDNLIQDVLSFSRISRGELPMEPIDPLVLIRELIESYPNLRASQIGILLPQEMPLVLANSAALTQCVSNLLGNAVKFVAPGVKPVVRISAQAASGRVKIWFKDNGIGIKEEDARRIFEIFQRVDRSHEGTGIGLAIVKKAAERMGGTVGVESKPGQGASFWLDLQAA